MTTAFKASKNVSFDTNLFIFVTAYPLVSDNARNANVIFNKITAVIVKWSFFTHSRVHM